MTDLCTLSDVKTYLRLSVTTDDAIISRLITACSTWMESYMSRTIGVATYIDVLDGTGTFKVMVENYPITSLTSFVIDGIDITDKIMFRQAVFSRIDGLRFRMQKGNIHVNYTAGFAVIPADLTQACIEMVAWRLEEAKRIGQSSKSAGGQETVSYQTIATSTSAKVCMDQYKRRFTTL